MLRRTCTVAIALALSTVLPARAAVPPVMVVTSAAFLFFPGDTTAPETSTPLRIAPGTTLEFAPLDVLGNHSLTSVEWRDGAPIFASALVGPGQVAEVVGVASLPVGTYEFTCSVHYWMHGTLDVVEQL